MVNLTRPQCGRGLARALSDMSQRYQTATESEAVMLTAVRSHFPKQASRQHSGSLLISHYCLMKQLSKTLNVVRADSQ